MTDVLKCITEGRGSFADMINYLIVLYSQGSIRKARQILVLGVWDILIRAQRTLEIPSRPAAHLRVSDPRQLPPHIEYPNVFR